MISSTFVDLDILYYRRHLFEMADKIGVEATCFILDAWEKEMTRLYKKYKSLFRLCRTYGKQRFENAAARANFYNIREPGILSFILQNGLDRLSLDKNSDIMGQQKLTFG